MTDRDEEGFGFAPEHDAPIPYMQRIRDYYQTLGYGAPYRWANYAEVPFAPLKKPLAESRIGLITTAAPHQPGKGDQGPGAAVQRRRQVLHGLFRRQRGRARSAHLAYRLRPHAHDGRGQQHLVPAAGAAAGGGSRPDRRGRAALSRRADQPQPPRHPRPGLPGALGAGAGRQGRRGRSRRGLTGVSPDRESGRPSPRSERHPDNRHGMRQGHRRTCRRAAVSVQRFPARQPDRQAARPAVAGVHARTGVAGAARARRRRARRCNRRCAGAPTRAGNSISRISPGCRPRRSRAAAPNSTGRRRSQRRSARSRKRPNSEAVIFCSPAKSWTAVSCLFADGPA